LLYRKLNNEASMGDGCPTQELAMRRSRLWILATLCLAAVACAPPAAKASRVAAADTAACGGSVIPPQVRRTPAEIAALPSTGKPGGVQTVVLYGDPAKPGLYTARLAIPAGFVLAAHTHEDTRTTTVVSGTWSIGYGRKFDVTQTKALPPGSLYSEPKTVAHFGTAKDGPVVLYVTGCGPSNTVFVDPPAPAAEPAR
jgi:hypothetical protein